MVKKFEDSSDVECTPVLLILRGLPGSGKTTLAKKIKEQMDFEHYEADMFFEDSETGEYKFDREKLSEAHEWCFNKVKEALEAGKNVIVANTFSRKWEYEKYLDLPYEDILIYTCEGNYENIHNVPQEAIDKMRERWEP